MLKLLEQYKWVIVILVVCLIGIGSLIYAPKTSDEFVLETSKVKENQLEENQMVENQIEEIGEGTENTLEKTVTTALQLVPVYICGEVKHPDVYYIEEDALVKDIVNMAGGFTEVANKEYLNLASKVQANGKIIVPRIGEEIDKSLDSYDNSESANLEEQVDCININTASVAELQRLQGIGEKKATAIKDYREKIGGFKSIEELTEVPNIGDKTFENIKDIITVQ